jgi:DNA ligase-1
MALANARICVSGTHSIGRKEMEGKILRAGGQFAKTCSGTTTYLIATPGELASQTSKVKQANAHRVPILAEAFLDACIAAGKVVPRAPYELVAGAAAAAPAASATAAPKVTGDEQNSAAADASQVLLAKKWDDKKDPAGWVMSEKLDGMRAYWSGKAFFSRNGNQLNPPAWYVKDLPSTPLDGELWCGRGQFQKCMSIVRKSVPTEDWKFVSYLAFDAPKHGGPYEERVKAVAAAIGPGRTEYARAVGTKVCDGQADLEAILKQVEAAGGEGLMLRQPGSLYEWKRSSTLLKVKTFSDEEAEVIGQEKGKGKNAAVMGALVCRTPDGRQFNCGSGFTDAQRRKPPKIGSVITYRYQELSNSNHPRFPTFVDVRTDLDWASYCAQYTPPDPKKVAALKRSHTILFTEKLSAAGGAVASGGAAAGGAASAAVVPPAKRGKVAASAPKKPKKQAGAAAVRGQWLWQTGRSFGSGSWKEYDAEVNATIERGWRPVPPFPSGKAEVTLGGTRYLVSYRDMEQRQLADESRVRKVKRLEVEVPAEEPAADGGLMASAASAAVDMTMDLAETGAPNAQQLLLVAVGGTATATSVATDRGGGPAKIVLPVDGSLVTLGRGQGGFIDPCAPRLLFLT